jgi:hypothetical protein
VELTLIAAIRSAPEYRNRAASFFRVARPGTLVGLRRRRPARGHTCVGSAGRGPRLGNWKEILAMTRHMLRSLSSLALGFALLAPASITLAAEPDAGSSAAKEEMVDNPEYKTWAERKAGDSITYEMNTVAAGNTTKMTMTQKLLELTKDKAVVELSNKIEVPGAPTLPPKKHEVLAKVKKSEAGPLGKMPAGSKGEIKENGSQKVEAAGKTYECKVYEFTGEQQGAKTTGKIWRSEKVPGGMVKMETNADVGGQQIKSTMTLTKIESK